MSRLITQIVKEPSGVVSYLNINDERVASTSSQVACLALSTTGIDVTDMSGREVFITTSNITDVNGVDVTGISTQDLWALLDSDVFNQDNAGGGGSQVVAYFKNDADFATISTTYVANLPSLTQTFEAGTYQIDHYCRAKASGTVRADFNIVVDTVQVIFIKEGLFSNPIPGVLCSTFVDLTAGEHTIDFQIRNESAAVTVTTSNRYYIITKIA